MVKLKQIRNFSLFVTLFVTLLLFVSVFFLMNYVQNLLNSDVRINLTEIVTQNKDTITSKLMLEVNNLDLISKQLMERYVTSSSENSEDLKEIFLKYARDSGDEELSCSGIDGQAIFANGQVIDISGRKYFRLAMQGKKNISERTVSRLTGEDIFVISAPLKNEGKIIGSVQKQYTSKEIYDLCMVSLFSEQGSMYIINNEGYILISSTQNGYSRESDNYYRMVYLNNPEEAKQLENDIKNQQSGFVETIIDGQKYFSAYTPVDQIYDWYLISSVATSAVSPNANIVIRLFYFILVVVVLFFAFLITYSTSLKNKQQAHLKYIAFVDHVTGGNTYTKFEVELKELLAQNPERDYYIFTFDIDNFKFINNFFGFDIGDKILHHVYKIYMEKLISGEFLARISSDHFVALLEDASPQRLNGLFQSEIRLDEITVYFSAGVYPICNKKESVNLMVDKANIAVRKIKGKRYKHVEVYDVAYDEKMIYNEQLKRSVEQALADDEIIPYFQPKVNIGTRTLVGAEALARWKKKDGKLVPPGDFIPICEETGLIVTVDMVIFEKTLQFLKHNLDLGISCTPISVNFSRMHLMNKDFLSVLLEKLKQYQVPAHLIELELTETVIFDNSEEIANFIEELHSRGLTISMDDFGSGYSSLHMLKDVPIDVLKIDRGFLKDTANSDRQKAIFATIAQMAERLKIKVVVEGVENTDHLALMEEFGCKIAQGFYFSRPVDPDTFEKILQKGKL